MGTRKDVPDECLGDPSDDYERWLVWRTAEQWQYLKDHADSGLAEHRYHQLEAWMADVTDYRIARAKRRKTFSQSPMFGGE
jgi:hypothetical protein